ncbi:hypothetical protein [Psychromonas sp. MME2]|uniref:hypothetical protein n=1 Tax=Psychromonas sp. MME2 TaxID=3231033 RepID=UPI00339CF082
MIEFDLTINKQAEIQGIGFDNDNSLSLEIMFQLTGTQNWGVSGDRDTGTGQSQHFKINVGSYYSGDYQYLVLVGDDDAQRLVVI